MRRLSILFLFALLFSATAVAVPSVATRLQGVFFPSRSASPLPTAQSPGFYNLNGVLQACQGSDAGTCYPMATQAAAGGSADGGTNVGSAAAAKIDTCSTGGTGTTCYRLKDIVAAMKTIGELNP